MKTITIALIGCLLCACSATTPTESAVNAATESITALEKSLPKECKTEAVNAQIAALTTQVENTLLYCENEKKVLELEKDRLLMVLFMMAVVMGVYIIKKIKNV
jgi:hypothetical protein